MTKPDITPEQAKNLDTLATHLEGLPDDYKHFNMETFEEETWCGTVACACGHGPTAGIKKKRGEDWGHYADRAFGASPANDNWGFLFSADWYWYQPTHHQAAERIRVFLNGGVPDGFSATTYGLRAYTRSLEKPND